MNNGEAQTLLQAAAMVMLSALKVPACTRCGLPSTQQLSGRSVVWDTACDEHAVGLPRREWEIEDLEWVQAPQAELVRRLMRMAFPAGVPR